MGTLKEKLHRLLIKKFGEEHMGTCSEMHPLAEHMLEQVSISYKNDKYKEFVSDLCDWMGVGPGVVMQKAPSEVFNDYLLRCAEGIQYATKKIGAPIKIDEYSFQSSVPVIDGTIFKDFDMVAEHVQGDKYHLIIKPAYFMDLIINKKPAPIKLNGRLSEKSFTSKERIMIAAAEEVLHFHQMQQNINVRSTYITAAGLDEAAYGADQNEQAGDVFKAEMIRELGLGSERQGGEQGSQRPERRR